MTILPSLAADSTATPPSPHSASDSPSAASDDSAAQIAALTQKNFNLHRALSVLAACMGGQVAVPYELMEHGFPMATTLKIAPMPNLNICEISVTAIDENGVRCPIGVTLPRQHLAVPGAPNERRTAGGVILST